MRWEKSWDQNSREDQHVRGRREELSVSKKYKEMSPVILSESENVISTNTTIVQV